MDFGLSEEQELLQETVRGFVANECPPPRLREIFDGDSGHDPTLWKGLLEMGLGGLSLREEHGGAGLEILDLALVSEILGSGAVPGPFLGHTLAGLAIQAAGSEAQRRHWLPRLASGEATGAVAFAEAGDRWQPEEWRLAATGDRLSGGKVHVPCASLADVLVVGLAGGELALVERDAPGSHIAPVEGVDRTRRVEELVLSDTPCELLPAGAAHAGALRDTALVMLAADAFGVAWKLVQLTVEYAGTREQFGTPLAQFQAVKHQIANMATDVEPTRGLFWYAAHAVDRLPEEAPRAAAIAKAHITDRALDTARAAVELHGGIGFTWECDVQIYFKRAMFDRAFLGTPEVHRERGAALAGW